MVQRISHLGDQTRAATNQIMELGAATEAANVRDRWMERDYPCTCHLIDSLHEDLTTARVEVREYQERHADLEERVIAE